MALKWMPQDEALLQIREGDCDYLDERIAEAELGPKDITGEALLKALRLVRNAMGDELEWLRKRKRKVEAQNVATAKLRQWVAKEFAGLAGIARDTAADAIVRDAATLLPLLRDLTDE